MQWKQHQIFINITYLYLQKYLVDIVNILYEYLKNDNILTTIIFNIGHGVSIFPSNDEYKAI